MKNFDHRLSIVTRDVEAVRARLTVAEEVERVQSIGGGTGVGFGGMRKDDTNMLLANAGGNGVITSLILHEGG